MARTHHHRGQKHRHYGHDYGARRPGNEGYSNAYGPEGRWLTKRKERAAERMMLSKARFQSEDC